MAESLPQFTEESKLVQKANKGRKDAIPKANWRDSKWCHQPRLDYLIISSCCLLVTIIIIICAVAYIYTPSTANAGPYGGQCPSNITVVNGGIMFRIVKGLIDIEYETVEPSHVGYTEPDSRKHSAHYVFDVLRGTKAIKIASICVPGSEPDCVPKAYIDAIECKDYYPNGRMSIKVHWWGEPWRLVVGFFN